MSKRQKAAQALVDRPAQANDVQQASESRSGAMVTVACKLPHGIIMQCCTKQKSMVPGLGATLIPIEMAVKSGESYRLNGNAVPFGAAPRCTIIGGYALTPNVPKEFWDRWVEENADLDMVTKKLIMAWPTQAGAADMAKEHASTRSGLEPINGADLKSDPRVPRKLPGSGLAVDKYDGKSEAA